MPRVRRWRRLAAAIESQLLGLARISRLTPRWHVRDMLQIMDRATPAMWSTSGHDAMWNLRCRVLQPGCHLGWLPEGYNRHASEGATICGPRQHACGVAVPDFRVPDFPGRVFGSWTGGNLVPTGPGLDWMVNVYHSWYIIGGRRKMVHSRSVAIGADSRVCRNVTRRQNNHSDPLVLVFVDHCRKSMKEAAAGGRGKRGFS
jgi:hypothetical protein